MASKEHGDKTTVILKVKLGDERMRWIKGSALKTGNMLMNLS